MSSESEYYAEQEMYFDRLKGVVPDTVPCGICGDQTPMTGTKRCDRCWELERRIQRDPVIARKILLQLNS